MKSLRHTTSPEILISGQIPEHTAIDNASRLLATPGGDVITVTPVLDTAIYAADDLLFDTTAINLAAYQNGGLARLESIVMLDESAQAVAIDLLFLNAPASLGTFNAAFAASDVLLRSVIGRANIATGDYLDLGNATVAQKANLGIVMKAGAAAQTIWVAGITRAGTPTYAASSLRFQFGFSRL